MTEKKWAREYLKLKFIGIIACKKWGQLDIDDVMNEFQSACESHAKAEIKKFAEMLKINSAGHPYNLRIDAALKKRGVE